MARIGAQRTLSVGALVAVLAASFLMLPSTTYATSGVAAAPAHFTFSRYATVSPSSGWSFVSGQFAGGGRSDVVGYHPSDGSVWVGTNVE